MDFLAAVAILVFAWWTIRRQEKRHNSRLWTNLKAQQETIVTLTRENSALHLENRLLRQGKRIPGPAPRIEPQPYCVGSLQ